MKYKNIANEKCISFELKEINEEVLLGCPEYLIQWLKDIEPLHRVSNLRPDDWKFRTEFIRKLYNFTCASCKKTEADSNRNKFHTHHIIPLERGGDNSFENLVCICENCHKKIHPHMRWTLDHDI